MSSMKLNYILTVITSLLCLTVAGNRLRLCSYSPDDYFCRYPLTCIEENEGECFPHPDCDQSSLCWGRLVRVNSSWVKSENYADEICENSQLTVELPLDECYEVDVFGFKYHSFVAVNEGSITVIDYFSIAMAVGIFIIIFVL